MRFLIWLVVLCWAVALLRRAASWILHGFLNSLTRQDKPNSNQPPAISSRLLVRDPVCGVHVPEERAIPLRIGGEVVHFCSVACRNQYSDGQSKLAANG